MEISESENMLVYEFKIFEMMFLRLPHIYLGDNAGHFNEVPVVENCFHLYFISPFNLLFAIRSTILFGSFSIYSKFVPKWGKGGGGSVLCTWLPHLYRCFTLSNASCDKIFKKFSKSEMKGFKLCSPCPEFTQSMFRGWLHFYWSRIIAHR